MQKNMYETEINFYSSLFYILFEYDRLPHETQYRNTWNSTGKHTMPGDSTINKMDTSPSAAAVDTVKMMNDTSQQ